MADIFQTPDHQVEVAPEDESVQPIVIRKLDRLETTSPSSNPSG
ncbi:MAG TPA: hypothetical protein VH520_10425 [Streptosporangiaceae bacterium]|jgi:hypothetical protein